MGAGCNALATLKTGYYRRRLRTELRGRGRDKGQRGPVPGGALRWFRQGSGQRQGSGSASEPTYT